MECLAQYRVYNIASFIYWCFFDARIAGFWGLANRIISLPMTVLGNAIAQVFYPQAASMKENQGSLQKLTKSFFMLLFTSLYIPFALLCVCAPFLFNMIFGEAWRIAGVYIAYLCPWAFLVLYH
jgi:O-antigen/teichoic acid export membrane protein